LGIGGGAGVKTKNSARELVPGGVLKHRTFRVYAVSWRERSCSPAGCGVANASRLGDRPSGPAASERRRSERQHPEAGASGHPGRLPHRHMLHRHNRSSLRKPTGRSWIGSNGGDGRRCRASRRGEHDDGRSHCCSSSARTPVAHSRSAHKPAERSTWLPHSRNRCCSRCCSIHGCSRTSRADPRTGHGYGMSGRPSGCNHT
jgi:hypothetical protein